MFGPGGPAAGQGSLAAMRMQKLPANGLADTKQVRRLERISAGIDDRLCHAVEPGIRDRLWFQRVIVSGMSNYNGELVKVMRPGGCL